MKAIPDRDTLVQWLEEKNTEAILDIASEVNPVDFSSSLEELEPAQIIEILSLLDVNLRAELFSYFSSQKQLEVFQAWPNRDFAPVLAAMRSNERVDFYQKLDAEDQKALLPYIDSKTRADLIHLSSYPRESAGGIMSTEFQCFRADETIDQVLEKIKSEAPRKKSLYYLYVVDEDLYLVGVLTFRDLLIHPRDTVLRDIMISPVVSAQVDDDREVVAQKMEEYNLITLPVTNAKGQIIGVVEHDVAIETIREEQTEDLQKFMGITREDFDKSYLEISSIEHFKKRISWVTILAIVGLVSGFIIHRFENALESLLILAFYMPMIADTGGNCGSQSATLVVRALALQEITVRDWWRIIFKELKVALLLGIVLGIIGLLKVLFISSGLELPSGYSLEKIALVIAIALALQVISSTLIGALLPLAVKAFGGDPAVAASPMITTVVDITGLLIYFGLAQLFLGLS
ncbi:MAG: magnesium transporter [Bdellovibrionaceae bacterium]|nr:magnesium transporter [Pseudobdellovibrionaceae bacterium]MDW8190417.1 magnesium transporter [Pseudobdellovibrionaceae bacterium]